MAVTREDVVGLLEKNDWMEPFATTDIAQALGVEEHCVRAAISWLCVAEVLRPVGVTKRLDKWSRLYDAATYQWNGQTTIPKVPRNREARESARVATMSLDCFDILLNLGRRKCGMSGA